MKKYLILIVTLLISLFSVAQNFYFGNDLSYVNQMEDCGAVYKEKNIPKDPYKIFADHGTNLVRIRLWNNPSWQNSLIQPAGVRNQYSDFTDVKKSISRAKSNGMQVMLDLALSDFWADPGHQLIPDTWRPVAKDTTALMDSVYNYVTRILTALNNESLMPEIVKVGNENNGGILLHTVLKSDYSVGGGFSVGWNRHAKMYNSAIKAIRNISKTATIKPKISLHYAGLKYLSGWYQDIINAGVTDFDIIGFSYYYAWHGGSIAAMGNAVRDLKNKFPKYEVMVVETGYLWSTSNYDSMGNIITTPDPAYLPVSPDKQLEYMVDMTREVMRAGGTGVIFWEPAWVSTPCTTPWGKGSSHDHVVFFDPYDTNFMENGGGRWTEKEFYENMNSHKVIFKVDVSLTNNSKSAFISGSFKSSKGKVLPMLNMGNNIFSFVAYLPEGETGTYFFMTDSLNREIIPTSCLSNGLKDRTYKVGKNDTVFSYIYSSCNAIGSANKVKVTFKVDMSGWDISRGVYITGKQTDWKIIKLNDSGNNIFSGSFNISAGDTIPYYFLRTSTWDNYKDFREIVPQACALMYGSDRKLIVPEKDFTISHIYGTCDTIGTIKTNINAENKETQNISIYPNPGRGIFFIKNKSNIIIRNVEVFDILGVKIKESSVNNDTLYLSGLPDKEYILKFNLSGKYEIKKIIIKR